MPHPSFFVQELFPIIKRKSIEFLHIPSPFYTFFHFLILFLGVLYNFISQVSEKKHPLKPLSEPWTYGHPADRPEPLSLIGVLFRHSDPHSARWPKNKKPFPGRRSSPGEWFCLPEKRIFHFFPFSKGMAMAASRLSRSFFAPAACMCPGQECLLAGILPFGQMVMTRPSPLRISVKGAPI